MDIESNVVVFADIHAERHKKNSIHNAKTKTWMKQSNKTPIELRIVQKARYERRREEKKIQTRQLLQWNDLRKCHLQSDWMEGNLHIVFISKHGIEHVIWLTREHKKNE